MTQYSSVTASALLAAAGFLFLLYEPISIIGRVIEGIASGFCFSCSIIIWMTLKTEPDILSPVVNNAINTIDKSQTCLYCGIPIEPKKGKGGKPKRFCCGNHAQYYGRKIRGRKR